MAETANTFDNDRLLAASAFAQTMIVVDDEAGIVSTGGDTAPPSIVKSPSRKDASSNTAKSAQSSKKKKSHPLDQKALVDQALDLGLVCAVVRPEEREGIVGKVSKAAERADIVSLDWEMNGDDGGRARSIIKEIIRRDSNKGGRVRLIAIYTGVSNRKKIYDAILDALSDTTKGDLNIRTDSDHIVSDHGLRIVWLFKGEGRTLRGRLKNFQVKEKDLPKRLQMEFSALSEGLLSNVALATIAAVRDSTHHVLAKFTGVMDGPYFHHRAFLKYPFDAEDYAVSVILSELKSSVDKSEVASSTAGKASIANRIRHLASNGAELKLHYSDKKGDAHDSQLTEDQVIALIANGWAGVDQAQAPKPLGKKNVLANCSSVFENSIDGGRNAMLAFASLTGTRSHPGSYLHGKMPQLVLGSVIHSVESGYLLCLQASCDVVRITDDHEFYFVRLEEEDEKPDHVVPIIDDEGSLGFKGLNVVESAYTKAVSLTFSPSGTDADATVRAQTTPGRKGYFFEDVKGQRFTWMANLKERRAMRSAQWVGNEMGRIGFDEFEPFRPDPKPEK